MNDGSLEMRTVIYDGDVDQMGLVLQDGGGERVKVDFGDGKASGARGWSVGTYVDRDRLEDVTDTHDLAKERGYTDTDDSDDD